MYKPSTYLIITYFPTYLPIYGWLSLWLHHKITYSKARVVSTMKPPLKPCTDSRQPDGQLAQPVAGTWMLNEASPPEAVRFVIHPSGPSSIRPVCHPSVRHPSGPSHHPSTESLTLQLSTRVGVVGGWRGGFFFQVVFGVESGQSMSTWTVDSRLSMQVLFGRGGEDLFSFQPMGRPKVACFYSF
jgi:hypothetical protein